MQRRENPGDARECKVRKQGRLADVTKTVRQPSKGTGMDEHTCQNHRWKQKNTTRTANIIFLEGSGVEVVATAAWSKREAESMWEISARGGKNNLPTPNRASHNLVQQQHPQQKHHAGRNKA